MPPYVENLYLGELSDEAQPESHVVLVRSTGTDLSRSDIPFSAS